MRSLNPHIRLQKGIEILAGAISPREEGERKMYKVVIVNESSEVIWQSEYVESEYLVAEAKDVAEQVRDLEICRQKTERA
jgi:hypothetical protein